MVFVWIRQNNLSRPEILDYEYKNRDTMSKLTGFPALIKKVRWIFIVLMQIVIYAVHFSKGDTDQHDTTN